MISVFVVEDSKLMRMILRKMLTSDPEIAIAGEAPDDSAALQAMAQKTLDVLILDLQMPKGNGLSMLSSILKAKPGIKVLVMSASTKDGAALGAEALKLGAVCMVQKPSSNTSNGMDKMKADVVKAVKEAVKLSQEGLKPAEGAVPNAPRVKESLKPAKKVVVICASTGGPLQIRHLITTLADKTPAAVVIAQQIHSKFTKILMKDLPSKLKESTPLTVNIANDGDVLCNGQVTFAPEEFDTVIKKEGDFLVIHRQPVTGKGGPSFDVLLKSVAEACGKNCIGIILTGDSDDGVAGAGYIKKAGGKIIVQDPTWGCPSPQMARCVIKAGYADYVVRIEDIAVKILEVLQAG